MKKQIWIVGVGMDGDRTLTIEGKEAISQAEVLIGAKRMLQMAEDTGKPVFACYDSQKIAEYIQQCGYGNIAVLMSGDCGFYSGAQKLLPLLEECEEYELRVVSGISSPVYFCSRIGKPWQNVAFVSLHGTCANVVRHTAKNKHTFFLLGGELSAGDVCQKLCAYGMGHLPVYIGEHLAGSRERITSGTAESLSGQKTDSLSVMLVENREYESYVRSGIADDAFLRGNVPMTKAEVRSVVLSKLAVKEKDICWDIGSGTGSVTVEMALHCTRGCVHAVEKKEEALELCRENCYRFRCDNVILHQGEALAVLEKLPAPDCVFIGGSGGQLKEVIQKAYAQNDEAELVVTAVSLETLAESVEIIQELGRQAEVVQIAVTRTKQAGRHKMLDAMNPIFIIQAKKKQAGKQ